MPLQNEWRADVPVSGNELCRFMEVSTQLSATHCCGMMLYCVREITIFTVFGRPVGRKRRGQWVTVNSRAFVETHSEPPGQARVLPSWSFGYRLCASYVVGTAGRRDGRSGEAVGGALEAHQSTRAAGTRARSWQTACHQWGHSQHSIHAPLTRRARPDQSEFGQRDFRQILSWRRH